MLQLETEYMEMSDRNVNWPDQFHCKTMNYSLTNNEHKILQQQKQSSFQN